MAARVTAIRSKRQRTPRRPPLPAFQFLVVLLDTDPLVWRRILVPGDYSFWDLHVAIQDAMGWQDSHLHEFQVLDRASGRSVGLGIPDPEFPDERPCTADWEARLTDYFSWDTAFEAPTAFDLYDFGDDWRDLVTLEAIGAPGSGRLPRCVGGARGCPPEDCGGVGGDERFLEAMADQRHPDHADVREWIGGTYDPDAFDPAGVRFDDPRKRWSRAFRR